MQKEEYNIDYSDSDSEESLTPTAPPAPPVASVTPPVRKKQSKLLEIQVEKKTYEDIEPITKRKYIRKNPIKVEDMNKKLEKARAARKPKIEKIVKDKKEKIVKEERTIINNYYYTKEDDKKEVVIKQPTASSLVGMQPIEKNNSKVIIKSKPLMTFV